MACSLYLPSRRTKLQMQKSMQTTSKMDRLLSAAFQLIWPQGRTVTDCLQFNLTDVNLTLGTMKTKETGLASNG